MASNWVTQYANMKTLRKTDLFKNLYTALLSPTTMPQYILFKFYSSNYFSWRQMAYKKIRSTAAMANEDSPEPLPLTWQYMSVSPGFSWLNRFQTSFPIGSQEAK